MSATSPAHVSVYEYRMIWRFACLYLETSAPVIGGGCSWRRAWFLGWILNVIFIIERKGVVMIVLMMVVRMVSHRSDN